MAGLISKKDDLDGPIGGSLVSTFGVEPDGVARSSLSALGPVGGALPVADPTSVTDVVLLGTDPKDGAAGATGGGETSLDGGGGGSCEARSGFMRISRSLISRSSRGSRERKSASRNRLSRSRSSLSR